MNPRSVYIAFEAFPRPKGASAHIASMVEALATDFSPVLLLCLGYGDMPAFQDAGDIHIQRFKAYHPNMLKRAFEFGGFVHETIDRYADSLELAVFRDPWGGGPLVGSEHNIPSIFEVNALPSWELAYTYPAFRQQHGLQAKIRDLERRCLRGVDSILTVSSLAEEALRNIESRCPPVTVIPNSAHPAFESLATRPPPHDTPLSFGYFGSLHPWQGVEVAVEAFALIADGIPHARMKIITAGRKDTRKALRKRIRKRGLEDRVDLVPGMPPEQLAKEIRPLAFTLAPLRETPRNVVQGCCPVKIIESMAAGVPVIASDLTVTRELIDDGHDGLLVRPARPRDLAHAMLRLLTDNELRERLSRNALTKAQTDFSRITVHERLHKVFRRTSQLTPAEVS